MSKCTRNVNFYRITANELDPVDLLGQAILKWQELKDDADVRRYFNTNRGQMTFKTCHLQSGGNYYYGLAYLVKTFFPELVNITDEQIEILEAEADPSKGIPEETHFVISLSNTYGYPIIGIESSAQGPRQKDLQDFLKNMLEKAGIHEVAFNLDIVHTFSYEDLLQRMLDVSKITMVLHRDEITSYAQFDRETADIFSHAMDFGNPQYVKLEAFIDFKRKDGEQNADRLKEYAIKLATIFQRRPEAKNHVGKLHIKVSDRNFGGRLRVFDLIESRVAIEVDSTKRRERSQYYDTTTLHASIRAEFEKEFRTRTPMVVLDL